MFSFCFRISFSILETLRARSRDFFFPRSWIFLSLFSHLFLFLSLSLCMCMSSLFPSVLSLQIFLRTRRYFSANFADSLPRHFLAGYARRIFLSAVFPIYCAISCVYARAMTLRGENALGEGAVPVLKTRAFPPEACTRAPIEHSTRLR